VLGDGVVQAAREPVDRVLERLVLERGHLAAAVADDVVVVMAAGQRRLEAGGGAHVDAPHEAEPRQQVERPVDARDAGLPPVRAQAVEHLLGREAAVLSCQQVDHRGPRTAAAVAAAAQLGDRVLGPLRACPGLPGHAADHSPPGS